MYLTIINYEPQLYYKSSIQNRFPLWTWTPPTPTKDLLLNRQLKVFYPITSHFSHTYLVDNHNLK